MNWSQTTLSPKPDAPPKVHIRYPCPGICRFAFMACFLAVGLGIYYGGTSLFGLERLNWAAPVWTASHVALVAVGLVVGLFAGLVAYAYSMTIEVRSERVSDLLIVLWQFVANGSLVWLTTIGIAMTLALGKEEAKAAVLRLGAEWAFWQVIAAGCVVGLLQGVAYFAGPIVRMPLWGYLAFTVGVALAAAFWHFHVYGIERKGWAAAAVVVPFLVLLLAPAMIERDRRDRRLVMERAQQA